MSSSPCASCEHLKALLQSPSLRWFESHGWHQARIARAMGVSRSCVSRWFTGGTIPDQARADLGRLVIQIVCEGGRHHE